MNGFAGFDFMEVLMRIFKYFFEGFVVAVAAFFIPGKEDEDGGNHDDCISRNSNLLSS